MSWSRVAVVLGAGGHGKVVVSALEAAGFSVSGAYDHDPVRWGERLLGIAVLGPPEEIAEGTAALIGVGDNRTRERLARLELAWLTVVHPTAWVHPSVELGAGAVVFAGALIQPDARLGRHAIVNTGALIDHDCQVGDFVHVAPGACLAGGVTVGTGALIGAGCAVVPGVTIGEWAVVGAGAAVIADVAPGATVKGVPAR